MRQQERQQERVCVRERKRERNEDREREGAREGGREGGRDHKTTHRRDFWEKDTTNTSHGLMWFMNPGTGLLLLLPIVCVCK